MSKHMPLDVRVAIEQDNPSIWRDEDRCIKCGMCKRVCEGSLAVHGHYDLQKTADRAVCIYCGQCANVCPPSSIQEVPEWERVRDAIADPDAVVVVSTSPAVRVSVGELFGEEPGAFVQGKLISLLRALGIDYVLDTNFAADLTVMEEAHELVGRIKAGEMLPQFTSCCPAWVRYVETFYPELRGNLSTAKSPIGMQGPTIKTYFAGCKGIDPKRIVNVALTPCTAKKFEIRREEMAAAAARTGIEGMRDMDYVVTVRELAAWAQAAGIDWDALSDDGAYDDLMGSASGAGVIFGNTGGVMEAALRTAYHMVTGDDAPADLLELEPIRGYEGIRRAMVDLGGVSVPVAVIHGTANARAFIEGEDAAGGEGLSAFRFVEVMACPGGCIGGGGQPKHLGPAADKARRARIASLYERDRALPRRCSYENPQIEALYRDFYGEPGSVRAECMLHTAYVDNSLELGA